MMTIKVKYHNNNIPKLNKIAQGDLIDLYAAETVELKKDECKLISLGVSMKLPEGYKANLYPRSSTYKNWGVTMPNSVGQIDNSYCGEGDIWKFQALAHRDTIIKEGDRICQFEIVPVMKGIEIEEVDKLDDSDRGGFGSTGTN
jgi:dUTP pyrophosphatase